MSRSGPALYSLLQPGSAPLILVHAYDDAERDEVRSLLSAMAPDEMPTLRTQSVDEALGAPTAMCFLDPEDEAAALKWLEQRRDEIEARTAPLVVFILAGGTASKEMADLPWLASFVRGREIDLRTMDAADEDERRDAFVARAGAVPEAWLERYRSGEFPDDEATNALAADALLLERRPS